MSEPFDPQSEIKIDESHYRASYYRRLEAYILRGEITVYVESYDGEDGMLFTVTPDNALALAEWLQGAATWKGLSES